MNKASFGKSRITKGCAPISLQSDPTSRRIASSPPDDSRFMAPHPLSPFDDQKPKREMQSDFFRTSSLQDTNAHGTKSRSPAKINRERKKNIPHPPQCSRNPTVITKPERAVAPRGNGVRSFSKHFLIRNGSREKAGIERTAPDCERKRRERAEPPKKKHRNLGAPKKTGHPESTGCPVSRGVGDAADYSCAASSGSFMLWTTLTTSSSSSNFSISFSIEARCSSVTSLVSIGMRSNSPLMSS